MNGRRILILVAAAVMLALAASAEEGYGVEEIHVAGSLGDVYGLLKTPAGEGPYPLVILSHGFGANHTTLGDYADAYVSRGFAALAFDFCGGGRVSLSDGTMTEMSVKTEEEDLLALIDWARAQGRFSRIHLFGESQGGFVSACAAADRAEAIASLTLLYPAFVLQDDARSMAGEDGGFPPTYNVMGMTIGRIYGVDALSFDVYDVIGGYRGDVLIMHGDRDGIVPLSYSERAEGVYASCRLTVYPGQGHGFAAPARAQAITEAVSFALAHEPDAE